MPEVHKRSKSLNIWNLQSLSTVTLLDEPGSKPISTAITPKTAKTIDLISGNEDLEEQVQILWQENQSLRDENAALELNSITRKMKIRPTIHLQSDPNTAIDLNLSQTVKDTNTPLILPIQCRMGESLLETENRLLREEIDKLQYVSRIWERYTAELGILQKENELLKEQCARFKGVWRQDSFTFPSSEENVETENSDSLHKEYHQVP